MVYPMLPYSTHDFRATGAYSGATDHDKVLKLVSLVLDLESGQAQNWARRHVFTLNLTSSEEIFVT